MKVPFVDLKAQYDSIKTQIDEAIYSVIENTAFIGGEMVSKFEKEFAAALGIKHVVSCANGTDSLEIILKAWGIGPGDEVIVPGMSWISTSESVGSTGAKSVFVEVDENGLMDLSKVKSKITDKTRAIIPVHLYGNSVDVPALMKLVEGTPIKVLEDCAQSHLSILNGKLSGTVGHAGSFSFYPGKNLGAYGDAGCIVTNHEELAVTCKMIANHGQQGKHNHVIEGRNSRLDGLQASILSAKLPYLKEWTSKRIQNALLYKKHFGDFDRITLPMITDSGQHVYHLFVIRSSQREDLAKFLKLKGIETAVHYPNPLPLLNPYRSYNSVEDFMSVEKFSKEILSLPMFAELTEEQIIYIVASIKEFYA